MTWWTRFRQAVVDWLEFRPAVKPLDYETVTKEIEEFHAWIPAKAEDTPKYRDLFVPAGVSPWKIYDVESTPPLKAPRKTAKAKVPKTATTPPPKPKTPRKSAPVKAKAVPKGRGRKTK